MALIGSGAYLGGQLLNSLNGSQSSGGSSQSAQNYSYNNSESASNTDASSAREFSERAAALAFERQKELMTMQMDFNAKEAQKERQWQQEMANTVYTRSINNMREAGINPILAANMGLSGASVGSGATASISGASAPMAQSFMDTSSASSAAGESWGESHGASWQNSDSGLATGLGLLASAISGALAKVNAGQQINIALEGLDKMLSSGDKNNNGYYDANDSTQGLKNVIKGKEGLGNWLKNELVNNGLLNDIKKRKTLINDAKKGNLSIEKYYGK